MSTKFTPTRSKLIIIIPSFVLAFTFICLLNYSSTSSTLLLLRASILTSQIFSFANDHPSPKINNDSCDLFDGRWVYDESNPIYYAPGSCPYVQNEFNCYGNGRSDLGYLKYRWQPYGCDLPRFDAKKMMEMLRGKKLVFIGDSLNRNMCQSLVCSLKKFKMQSSSIPGDNYFYNFKDYNFTIVMVTAPFLIQRYQHSKNRETLRLDTLEPSISKYIDADLLIFNTGHWWNHNNIINGENLFQEGDVVHKKIDVKLAYTKALTTWAKWIDCNVNRDKTRVFFSGFSNTHFRGGDWDTGGTCDIDTEPIIDQKLLIPYPWLMQELERVISEMKIPVSYLNITKLTDYRKDSHPSIFRSHGSKPQKGMGQDCSHWCLPGVPDSWNHLLFASLLSSLEV